MNDNLNNHTPHCMFAGRRLKKMLVLVLLVLALFLVFKTLNTIKEYRFIGGGISVVNTINVLGKGEVFAVPDIAEFSFSVVEEKETVEKAQEIATQKVNNILSFLKDSGIKETDIKTINYNVYSIYEFRQKECSLGYCPPGERVLEGFEINQSVSVKVRDIESSGKILLGIGERGAVNISGLNFIVDAEEELRDTARKKAIEDARDKAKQLAKDLNVKLARVVSFSESGGQPYYKNFELMEAVMDGAGDSATPEIPVGENKIVSNVSITYEIR